MSTYLVKIDGAETTLTFQVLSDKREEIGACTTCGHTCPTDKLCDKCAGDPMEPGDTLCVECDRNEIGDES